MLQALDRHRVNYIVIGAFARVIHGADEVTDGLDIVPSSRPENVRRLATAIREIGTEMPTESPPESPVELMTPSGNLKVVFTPVGTQGYDDLRRAATRQPLGRGSRPAVASIGDLARMLSAQGGGLSELYTLRRIAEIDHGLGMSV